MPDHILTLEPTDVLFFKDGRPMEGSSSGHGAAWPHPHVLNAALHAALWRSKEDFDGLHPHRPGRSGSIHSDNRTDHGRLFGSFVSAGPFPITKSGTWLFPRPADAPAAASHLTTLLPFLPSVNARSSLHPGLYPVINTCPPSKAKAEPWWDHDAFQAYLGNSTSKLPEGHFCEDASIHSAEHTVGIGTDPETGTQDGERIYSASYLRLKPDCKLGLVASCIDKKGGDLIARLFPNDGTRTTILVGGQQRCGSVERKETKNIPLPLGLSGDFSISTSGKHLLKWILLTPAIWPAMPVGTSNRGTERMPHCGGWLPSWIDDDSLNVLLQTVSPEERRRRRSLNYDQKGYASGENASPIAARLVAALVPKPQIITGWSLADSDEAGDTTPGGAKSTHLAVPAGAVYYFECDSAEAAQALATAINWHGDTAGTAITNRRSTLMGEKGFGLGVCGTWNFHACSGNRSEA
jgi:CRISPR-associated protein Cmr3